MTRNSRPTRRQFLGTAGALAAPLIIPSSALGRDDKPPPSKRITVGVIGTGNMGMGDLRGFLWWGNASGFTGYNVPNSNAPDVMTGGVCNVAATWNIPCTTVNSTQFPRMTSARSRHNAAGGVNVAFCDGHADSLADRYTETDDYNAAGNFTPTTGFLSPDNSLYGAP